MPNPASPNVARALLDDRPVQFTPTRLPVACVCPLEYATRQHGSHTVTFRVHVEGCKLAELVADQDACR